MHSFYISPSSGGRDGVMNNDVHIENDEQWKLGFRIYEWHSLAIRIMNNHKLQFETKTIKIKIKMRVAEKERTYLTPI